MRFLIDSGESISIDPANETKNDRKNYSKNKKLKK